MGSAQSFQRRLAIYINDPIIVDDVSIMVQSDEDWSALFEAQHVAGRLDCLNDIMARKSFLFNRGPERWSGKNRALTAAVKDYVLRHHTWCEEMLARGKRHINGEVQPPMVPFFFGGVLDKRARMAGHEGYRDPMRRRPASW